MLPSVPVLCVLLLGLSRYRMGPSPVCPPILSNFGACCQGNPAAALTTN